jgi:hypothetical protein
MQVMLRHPPDADELELELLVHRYRDVLNQYRVQGLRDRLEKAGPLAVRETWASKWRSRMRLWLDDDTTLVLRLIYPRWKALAEITALRFVDGVGWVLDGRHLDGTPSRTYAWLVQIQLGGPSQRLR